MISCRNATSGIIRTHPSINLGIYFWRDRTTGGKADTAFGSRADAGRKQQHSTSPREYGALTSAGRPS